MLTSQRAIQSSALGWRILQRARLAGLDAKRMGPMREIVGIGTALGIDETSGTVQITAAVPNSPAAQAGLTAGLVVRSIDGVPTKDKTLAECLSLIRGPAGKSVKLELIHPGRDQPDTVELTRKRFMIDA